MTTPAVHTTVRRVRNDAVVIDLAGDVTAAAEPDLLAAWSEASDGGTRLVALNFTGLDYMNSGGIGLLVTLLVRANRSRQRLVAYGLPDHYRQIFGLTRLDEAIGLHDTEAGALSAPASVTGAGGG